MSKIFKILKREYLIVVKTKAFLIGTILAPLFMIGAMTLPILLSQVKSENQKMISVIDETGIIYDEFVSNLDDKLSDGREKYLLNNIRIGHKKLEDIEKELQNDIKIRKISGYIHIPEDVFQNMRIDYYARNVTNFNENRRLRIAVNRAVVKQKILDEGLEPSVVMKLTRGIRLQATRIAEGEKKEGGMQTYFVAFILVFVLYMTILTYGTFVMRSVVEEKSSRIVEILISSVKPFELMAGKIFGISLVGFTQYLIWILFGLLVFSFREPVLNIFMESPGSFPSLPTIPPIIFAYFILFFILGYLLYSGLFAAVGAVINNESESRSYMFPIIMPLILPIMMMSYITGNPDSTTTIFLSLFPLTSPTIMLTRISVSSPPFIEIAGSVLILILTIIAEIWVVAKIYRVGILMYGKKPGIGEIIKWIKYS
ncbi:ABC transporter permease [bacterium]|nr:ABC transporter permease [bacterium]